MRVEFLIGWVDEPRWMLVGKLAEKLWSVVFVRRGQEGVRIISARRSAEIERLRYEEEIPQNH